MTDFAQVKKNALKNARIWARQGNRWMAQNFLDQAEAVGYVSDRQVKALNRMMAKARENASADNDGNSVDCRCGDVL